MDKIFLLYLLTINLLAFIVMLIDKRRAIKKQWRISENTLIGISIAGGAIGMLFGIYTFRHKTKHIKFTLGVPAILVIQIYLLSYVL